MLIYFDYDVVMSYNLANWLSMLERTEVHSFRLLSGVLVSF